MLILFGTIGIMLTSGVIYAEDLVVYEFSPTVADM